MTKVIKLKFDKMDNSDGEVLYEIPPENDQDRVCSLWFSSEAQCAIYFETEEKMLPLFGGYSLDQSYAIPPEVIRIRIVPSEADALVAHRLIINDVWYKDHVDPIPDEVPIPIDEHSLETRVRNAVLAQMEAMGVEMPAGKGRYYAGADDENDDDPSMGPGYQYDEDIEAEVLTQAIKNVRADIAAKKKAAAKTPEAASTPPVEAPAPEPKK